MKPTLEQIKTDESVWPDGATHYIGGCFTKWIDDIEHSWINNKGKWVVDNPSWPLEKYEKDEHEMIKRPTKAFVPEVGFHGECTYAGRTLECVVVLKNRVCIFDHGFELIAGITHDLDIRTIKSERELFVDAAVDCHSSAGHSELRMLNAMYDSGKFKLVEPTK
jgi:hypothetical protein